MLREAPHTHTLEDPQGEVTSTTADNRYTAAMEYAAALEEKSYAQAERIIEVYASVNFQTVLTKSTDFSAIVVLTGAKKELTEIRAMMKQLEALVTAQDATVAALFTKITEGGGGGSGWDANKNKVRPGLHVCAHCKREVYHKDANCLELYSNKEKCYTWWKSIFAKE